MQQRPFPCPKSTELDMICPSFRDDMLPPLRGSIRPGCQGPKPSGSSIVATPGSSLWQSCLDSSATWGGAVRSLRGDLLHLTFVQMPCFSDSNWNCGSGTDTSCCCSWVCSVLTLTWSWAFPLSGHVCHSRGRLHRQSWWVLG